MTCDEIEKIILIRMVNSVMRISFRTRNALNGLFIKTADYKELSRKNLDA